jgi:hypothetical protein
MKIDPAGAVRTAAGPGSRHRRPPRRTVLTVASSLVNSSEGPCASNSTAEFDDDQIGIKLVN